MGAGDFRGIGRPAQEELRRRALWLILREGRSQGEAALAVGVARQTVNLWLKRYRAAGDEGLLDGRRVSPRRGKGLLSEAEARQVRGWIADRLPGQLKLPFALWTSRAVRELIEQRFGKRLGLSTVQLYLQRWGMTPQKPLARAKERSPAAIARWLERDYPAIAARAKAEGAVIYWGDETGISNQDQIGRTYAPKGETPVVVRTTKRLAQSMIAGISNRGLMRFMLHDGALNASLFLTFLRRLIRDAGQKVFLIVDNLPVHRAHEVKAWVESHANQIALFHLPSYAPDHNPSKARRPSIRFPKGTRPAGRGGEHLNNDLEQQLRQKPQPTSKEQLAKGARNVLRAIQRSPKRIRSYFSLPTVRYAARDVRDNSGRLVSVSASGMRGNIGLGRGRRLGAASPVRASLGNDRPPRQPARGAGRHHRPDRGRDLYRRRRPCRGNSSRKSAASGPWVFVLPGPAFVINLVGFAWPLVDLAIILRREGGSPTQPAAWG